MFRQELVFQIATRENSESRLRETLFRVCRLQDGKSYVPGSVGSGQSVEGYFYAETLQIDLHSRLKRLGHGTGSFGTCEHGADTKRM